MGDEENMRSSIYNRWIRKIIATGIGLGCVLLFPLAAHAARDVPAKVTVTLNPENTSIQWTLQDILHTVHGTFALKSGVVHLDPTSGTANGLIIVEARSGKSGNKMRDHRMQKGILESSRYPEITFTPTQFFGSLDFSKNEFITVNGVFRLHGKAHALQLHLHVVPQANHTLHLTTEFVVPYVQWGLKDPSTFILRVGKTVAIDVSGAATVTP